jgi:hypothetical protein
MNVIVVLFTVYYYSVKINFIGVYIYYFCCTVCNLYTIRNSIEYKYFVLYTISWSDLMQTVELWKHKHLEIMFLFVYI